MSPDEQTNPVETGADDLFERARAAAGDGRIEDARALLLQSIDAGHPGAARHLATLDAVGHVPGLGRATVMFHEGERSDEIVWDLSTVLDGLEGDGVEG